MFGLNDGNENPDNDQNIQGPPDVIGPVPSNAPVHGPLSNISPGGAPIPPAPSLGVAVSPTFSDINLPDSTPAPPLPMDDDLLGIKHQALESLTPLISHLNQSAEEKFKTTMMLIQASDNSELLKEAYEAANQIEDEKVRAQALLDVVNEINYFTHQQKSES